jgi:hypothetical protein
MTLQTPFWHKAALGDRLGHVETNQMLSNRMNSTLTRRDFLRTASTATLAAASLPSALAQADKKLF